MLATAPAEASASNLVFVCGKSLCAAGGDGEGRVKLTRDGARKGGYTRPSLSRGGKRMAWVELRANVVFGGFDFRRLSARVDGSGARQEASNGGRPFVAWAGATRIIREGIGPGFDGKMDAGLCVPAPQSETNGTCTAGSRQLALDPGGRHLRHPSLAPNGLLLVATAYVFASSNIDTSIERPGAIALYDTSSAGRVRDLRPVRATAIPRSRRTERASPFSVGRSVDRAHERRQAQAAAAGPPADLVEMSKPQSVWCQFLAQARRTARFLPLM